MATLTKGKTFTNGETVTPQKLHELVDLGAISGIVNADIAAGAAIADSKLAQITTAGKVLPAAVQGTAVVTADPRLSDARTPVPHTHAISDTTGLQTALDGKQAAGSYAPATGIAQSAVTNLTTDLAGKAASSHTHSIANVTGLQTALDGKQASGSYAPATGIAQSAVTNLTTDLAGKAASSHTHDDRYYTESEIDTKLSGLPVSGHTHTIANVTGLQTALDGKQASGSYAAASHTHAISDTTGLQTALDGKQASGSYAAASHTHDDRYYTETEMNTLLAGKQASGSYAAASHTHAISDTTGLQTALDGKQAAGSYAPATGIAQSAVTNLTTDLAGKAASSHTHDDRYYTETEIDTKLSGLPVSGHTHSIANVTGLQTALDGKQAAGSYAPATGIAPSAITGTAVVTSDSRLIPTGAIMPFAFNAFAGIPDGWAECNGFAVSRSTYNTLYQVIGTTYGAGDGSTTFNLPDLRGYFIRGSGTNVDGTTSGGFGLKQSDDVKPHVHPFSLSIQSLVLSVQAAFGTRTTGGSQAVSDITVTTGSPSASASISSNSGTETRPKNIAMMYCIKF